MERIMRDTRAGPIALYRTGSGAPVLLLHGNGHSIHEFDRVVPHLARDFTVIGWDMPGHGESAAADPDLSIAGRAAILAEALDGLVAGPVTAVGASIGAFVAAEHAARQPDRVAALVLSEMQVRTRDWWIAARPMVEQLFGTARQDFDTVRARLAAPPDAALFERWNADRERAGAPAMLAAMAAIRDHDLAATLAALQPPTLFLFGEAGPAVACAEAARTAMPAAASRVISGAGHFISIDQPEAFANAVAAMARGHKEG
jgi:pimeloyl-ACP methyl ester carboxylesterase